MFEFDWPVDRDGYEWAEDAGAGWILRRRGGPNRFYRPLEDNPGLFRRFASLALPLDRNEILNFTNNFGFIDRTMDDEFFLLDQFFNQLSRFKLVVSDFDSLPGWQAEVTFLSLMHPRFTLSLDISNTSQPLQVIPTTLYGALMVQLAQEIAGIAKFRKCKHCPEWFPLGKGAATTRREFCSDRCRVAWHRSNIREINR